MHYRPTHTPPYGWEDTYIDGTVLYDGTEYGGRTTRRNDEVEITTPSPNSHKAYPFNSFLQRPTNQMQACNFFAGTSGYAVPCSFIRIARS